MLTAYMDESSHEAGRVVIGGFLGAKESWLALKKEWKAALERNGKRSGLHMKRLRWKGSTQKLLAELAPIPRLCNLRPLYSTIDAADYEDLIENPLDKFINKTYQHAVMALLLLILDRLPREERIKFVFDEQTTYKEMVRVIFRVLKKYRTPNGKPRLAGVEFVSKSLLTQPGDYLAYAITQVNRDKHSLKASWCAPIILEMVKPGVAPISAEPDSEFLRDVIRYAKANS